METHSLICWITVMTLGMVGGAAQSVAALDIVQYYPPTALRLDPNSGNTHNFGTIHIESDSASGWTLQVQSSNEGALGHSGSQASIPYILRIDGETVNNLANGNSVNVRTTSNLSCPPPGGCDYEVEALILSNNIDGKPSGSYSDRLTFTLVSP